MRYTGANSLIGVPNGRFDGHAHVFASSLPMAENRRYTPTYDAMPETYFALLKQFQLDGALLVQPSFLGSDNNYLLGVLRRFSGLSFPNLRGVVVLDPTAQMDIGLLKEWSKLGVVGVRLNVFRREHSFQYDDWAPVLKIIEKLGWHIEIHCSAAYMPQVLPRLTAKHAKIVVDHLGLVESTAEQIGLPCILSQPREQLWIKVSALYRNYPNSSRSKDKKKSEPLRQLYLEHFGGDRLVWGSDWPFTQFEGDVTFADTVALNL